MFVVADDSELNWWLRPFALRISLRLTPDFVEVVSPQGVARSAAVLSVVRKGDRAAVAGIGDEPVADSAADRIRVFEVPKQVLTVDAAVARLFSVLLKRLPSSGGFIRPVVVVEGLPSLDASLGGQHVAFVTRALAACGAAAAVIRDVAA